MSNPVFSPQSLTIRPIQPQDNPQMEALISSVLKEFGCVGPGFASNDPELKNMYAKFYVRPGAPVDRNYWVITDESTGRIYGGGGFSPLQGTSAEDATCELQKLYFHADLRGMGFGRKMVEHCMAEARNLGYRTMYLETVSVMKGAIALYQKMGFRLLEERLGATGHFNCDVYMVQPLVVNGLARTLANVPPVPLAV